VFKEIKENLSEELKTTMTVIPTINKRKHPGRDGNYKIRIK
jgi:hypothetical protein